LPENLRSLPVGEVGRFEKCLVVRTPQGQFRLLELAVELKEPAKPQKPSPVVLMDQSQTTTGGVICVLTADGKLRLNTLREQKNLLTGESTFKLGGVDLPYQEPGGRGPPKYLFLSAVGDQVYLFWEDGHLMRFDARDRSAPKVAETREILEAGSIR